MQEKIKRYAIFLIGLFINSLGVSFITKADLGTSPISSIPYVLSLKFSWTLGEFTIIFNVFIVLLQLILLRKKFKLEYWIQIPVTFLFGYFIDLTMVFGFHESSAIYFKNFSASCRMSDSRLRRLYRGSGRCCDASG